MKLLLLRATNFLSIDNITLQMRKRGLVLIDGRNEDDPSAQSNGAGKSSIVDALRWCLFGTTSRGYDADDVINNKVGKNCWVSAQFIVNGQRCVVDRHRNDEEHKNRVALFVDGIEVTKPSIAETNEAICRLIGMTEQTFVNSVVFGQTPGYRFSRLTDKAQKEVLDDALGIARYAAACEAARACVKREHDHKETWEVKVEEAEHDIEAKQEDLEELLRKRDEYTSDAQKRLDKIDKRLSEIKRERKTLAETLESLTADEIEYERIEKAHNDVKAARQEVEERILELQSSRKVYTTERIKLESRIAHQEGAKHRLIKADTSEVCTECGQLITPGTVGDHLKKLKREKAMVEAQEKEVDDKVKVEFKKSNAYVEDIKELSRQLTKLDFALAKKPRYEAEDKALKKERDSLQEQRREVEESKNPYGEMALSVQEDIERLKVKRGGAKLAAKSHADQEERYAFWVEAFGTKGLRSYLIDTALPFLNERVAEYARALTSDTIEIEFKTQGTLKSGKTVDRFEVVVKNKHGAHSYRGNSAGESGKIDLCVGLALQDLVMSRSKTTTNVAFFDEAFEGIDAEGCERVIELLAAVAAKRETVFVITHHEELKSYFPSSVTMVKRGGLSTLED